MDLMYIWITIGIIFIIIEMFTVTLFWLSMWIASFVIALYVYYFDIKSFEVIQMVIFATISTLLIFSFPKLFQSSRWWSKTWIEVYIGNTYTLKKVKKDWKLEIDWVDYLVNDSSVNESFEVWKKVKVISSEWTSLNVTIV